MKEKVKHYVMYQHAIEFREVEKIVDTVAKGFAETILLLLLYTLERNNLHIAKKDNKLY